MYPSPHNASPKNDPLDKFILLCRICHKPVPAAGAKADDDGQAIHEECYALKIKLGEADKDDT